MATRVGHLNIVILRARPVLDDGLGETVSRTGR
jgi:hypothetical protein